MTETKNMLKSWKSWYKDVMPKIEKSLEGIKNAMEDEKLKAKADAVAESITDNTPSKEAMAVCMCLQVWSETEDDKERGHALTELKEQIEKIFGKTIAKTVSGKFLANV